MDAVKVDTSAVTPVDVVLQAGEVGETVTVVADAPLINAESGVASTTVTERQIQDIPLNNRSVLDLAVTAPGVTGDAGSEDRERRLRPARARLQPLASTAGGPASTAILADGVNNTGVGIARSVVSFTPETVQEFTVQTSAFSAEYGTTGGGTINVTTKSGTNDFNGVALWYHRNPKFNATPFTTSSATRPTNNLRSTQVSATAGGPVYLPRFGEGGPRLYDGHNKTFFFVAFEPRWRTDFASGTALVPTAAERTGNFNNLTRTVSGLVPADVAARFGQASVGNANIYQQFIRGPSGGCSPSRWRRATSIASSTTRAARSSTDVSHQRRPDLAPDAAVHRRHQRRPEPGAQHHPGGVHRPHRAAARQHPRAARRVFPRQAG